MITLITGAPGAGKSAALVSLLMELSKGRAVYAHGIPELKVDHQVLDDPTKWMDTVPDGSIIAMDEAQGTWRPMGPGQKVPDHIAALETHRHRGLDFYVLTQAPRLIHSNVRALVGRHVHLRDLGLLGRWWYEWPETAANCETGWKNALIKKRYRLPKKAFGMYKSASEHIKPVRSVPWMVFVAAGALIATVALSYVAYKRVAAKTVVPVATAPVAATAGTGALPVPSAQPAPANFIDDRIAWVPRVSSKPESAPAYDGLRQVVNLPVVVAAVCNQVKCVCYTSQGTDAGLSVGECRQWLENRPFDPYTARQVQTAAIASDQPKHAAE